MSDFWHGVLIVLAAGPILDWLIYVARSAPKVAIFPKIVHFTAWLLTAYEAGYWLDRLA